MREYDNMSLAQQYNPLAKHRAYKDKKHLKTTGDVWHMASKYYRGRDLELRMV